MRKLIMTAIGLAATATSLWAQSCGTDYLYNTQLQNNPALRQAELMFNADAAAQKGNTVLSKTAGPTIIPVVFHVFHTNGPENITRAQIEDQIRILNLDYRRLNADTVNTRPIFKPLGADCNIEFRMATKDPNGNCTDGIIRYYTNFTDNADDNIKYLSTWPPDRYLNIWVVKNIKDQGQQGTILGYAQFPWVTNATRTDGVLIRHDYIGTIGTSSVAKAGRVATHEVGHWLGLYHPFQDSCSGGDAVDDTPPVASASFGCMVRNSCHIDNPDLPDMHENFMDYADGNCQNIFTYGQLDRIKNTFANIRVQLISPSNLIATGVADGTPPSACIPRATFSADNQFICANSTVTFKPSVYNGTVDTYKWEFEGGSPATTTDANPVVTYSNPGVYKVKLSVSNNLGESEFEQESFIHVSPSQPTIQAPYYQGFEGVPQASGWERFGNNNAKWEFASGINAYEGGGYATINNAFLNNDYLYELISPNIDFTSAGASYVSFWYAYTPRMKNGVPTEDKLSVMVSTDCGKTWISRWNRAGKNLNTLPAVPTNPSIVFMPNGKEKWKQVIVDMKGNPLSNVQVKFSFLSKGGNNIFLDEINLGGASTGILSSELDASGLVLFPNPSSGELTLAGLPETASNQAFTASLVDISGRTVATFNGTTPESLNVDLSALIREAAQGVYQVSFSVNGQNYTQKLVLQ